MIRKIYKKDVLKNESSEIRRQLTIFQVKGILNFIK